MATTVAFPDCLRLLRRQIHIRSRDANKSLRAFSYHVPRLQTAPTTKSFDTSLQQDDSKIQLEGPSTAEIQRQLSASLSGAGPASNSVAGRLASKYVSTGTTSSQAYLVYGTTQGLLRMFASQADYTIPESQRSGLLTGEGPAKTAEGEDLGQPIASLSSLSPASSSSAASPTAAAYKDNTFWFEELSLQPTFSTWSQVTYLHMYMYLVRLRASSPSSPSTPSETSNADTTSNQSFISLHQQYLVDHFSHAAEEKMILYHNMAARGIRNRYLKDLFLQWRGLMTAYDEGLVKGDAVLAAALWRNLWKGRPDVDWVKVGMAVAFVRRGLLLLAQVPDHALRQGGLGRIRVVDQDGLGEWIGDAFSVAKHGLADAVVEKRSRGVEEDVSGSGQEQK